MTFDVLYISCQRRAHWFEKSSARWSWQQFLKATLPCVWQVRRVFLFIRWLGFFRGVLPAILKSLCELYVFLFKYRYFVHVSVSPNFLARELPRKVFCLTFPHWARFALRSCVEIANWCWAVCRRCSFHWTTKKNVEVVSTIFYFHPYLGKWSNLTNIFQMGWNHQLDDVWCLHLQGWGLWVGMLWPSNFIFAW